MALATNAVTIIKLFKAWDENHDGKIVRTEFETGLRALGLDVPSASIHDLFSKWDRDGSGELTLNELTATLNSTAALNELTSQLGKGSPKLTDLFRKVSLLTLYPVPRCALLSARPNNPPRCTTRALLTPHSPTLTPLTPHTHTHPHTSTRIHPSTHRHRSPTHTPSSHPLSSLHPRLSTPMLPPCSGM